MESGNASIQFGLLNPTSLGVTSQSGPTFGLGSSQAGTSQILVTGMDGVLFSGFEVLGFSSSVNAPTVVPTPLPMVPMVTLERVNTSEKPEKIAGTNFKRWQQKMTFYLTTIGLVKCIRNAAPVLTEGADRLVVAAVDAWKHSDFLCKNCILNSLDDKLYAVYSEVETARNLWDALDKKYKVEDAGYKNFVAGKFLRYEMKDSKPVMTQIHEIQVLLHEMTREGLIMNETLAVACIVEKLPPGWVDFRSYHRHKRKGMTLMEISTCLRIEEDNRAAELGKLGKLKLMLWKMLQNAMLAIKGLVTMLGTRRRVDWVPPMGWLRSLLVAVTFVERLGTVLLSVLKRGVRVLLGRKGTSILPR